MSTTSLTAETCCVTITTTLLVPKIEEGQTYEVVDDQGQYQYQRPRQKQYGQVYRTTVAETVQDSKIITSILLIRSVPATMLFDFGSTLTVISCEFALRLGVVINDLEFDLIVTMPTGLVVTTTLCVRYCCGYLAAHLFGSYFVAVEGV